jgi:hypothetical protein
MEIYRDPANAFVAGFIGNTNLLPCRLSAAAGDLGHADRPGRGRPREMPRRRGVLSVRPEDVRFAGQGLPAKVSFIRDLGESVQFVLDSRRARGDRPFRAARPPSVGLGDTVHPRPSSRTSVWCWRHERWVAKDHAGLAGGDAGVWLAVLFLIPFAIMLSVSVAQRVPGGFFEPGFDLDSYAGCSPPSSVASC